METATANGVWPWHGKLTAALAAALILIFLAVIWRSLLVHLRIFLALWSIPGPLAYPIVGNALMLTGGSAEFFRVVQGCYKRYGPLFRLWVGPRPIVFLCGADEVQPILSSSVHIEKSEEYMCLDTWLATGLLTSGGKKWHMRRKLLTGAFHSTVLEGYIDSLDREAELLVSKLSSLILTKNPSDWSEGINVVPMMKLCALDAICDTIMGFNAEALEGSANAEYVNAIHRVTAILQHRFISPWLRPDLLFNMSSYGKEYNKCLKVIHNFTQKVIKERKEEILPLKESDQTKNSKGTARKSFLDLLLNLSNNGEVLSDDDIKEEVDTFMFAGHDTTAAALNWSLFALGNHPKVQESILDEEKIIMGKDGDREMTIAQLGKLEYLDCCIKEVLRMFPSVPLIGRELQSPLTIMGHTFPAKTTLNISTFLLHHDPAYFPNPEKFDPDRFLNSAKNVRHPFAYAPFSAGSRNCIGQKFAMLELKIMIRKILKNFELRSLQSMEDVVIQGEVILNSPNGIHLAFRKRDINSSVNEK